MSNKWSLNKQLAVYSKTNFRCAYCGKQLNFEPIKLDCGLTTCEFAIDHVIPKSKGGSNDISNLLPSCKTCNISKGTKSLEEFRFSSTLKDNNIPSFSKLQLSFLKNKIGSSGLLEIFPKPKKFYFETLNDGDSTNKSDYVKIYSERMNNLKWDSRKFNVHHIDFNHNNNEFSNLVLLPTKLHHRFHFAFEKLESISENHKDISSPFPEDANTFAIFKDYIDNFLDLKMEVSFFWTMKIEYLKPDRPLGLDPENRNFEDFVKSFSKSMYQKYCC